jgi:hypothetical protein
MVRAENCPAMRFVWRGAFAGMGADPLEKRRVRWFAEPRNVNVDGTWCRKTLQPPHKVLDIPQFLCRPVP